MENHHYLKTWANYYDAYNNSEQQALEAALKHIYDQEKNKNG